MSERKTHEKFITEMNDINKNIIILDRYMNAKTKLLCECKIHSHKWYSDPDHLLRGQGCPLCAQEARNSKHKKKTHEEFVKACKISNPDIEILNEYTGILDNVKCRCKKCEAIYYQKARYIIDGKGCPVCANVKVIKGINDIATTNPEIILYFKNKEDAYKYTYGCDAKITFKCPICGFEKNLPINHVTNNGYFSCPRCSDGISYPNKFSREFLNQLPVSNIEYEYSPEWANRYSYDNYFEYNNQKYILEMDGAFHYIRYYKSNLSLEDTQKVDRIKDDLALKNNIKIIRIDCFYSTKEYIVKNILNSELSSIFDLSEIDWDLCDKKANKSLIKSVCDYYDANPNLTVRAIAKTFKLQESTVSKYLYKGNEFGICNYHPKNKIPLSIKSDNEFLSFETIADCARYLSEKYPDNGIQKIKRLLNKRIQTFEDVEIAYM
jgi:hypothetical protein